MDFSLWEKLYFFPAYYGFCLLLLTMLSKRVSKALGIQGWSDFITLSIVSLVPVVNIFSAVALTVNFVPNINLPYPRGWKRP
ncbi:MAG: hypothetical protein ACRDCE_05900 [Cetobacterium sp.]|uniref:hypothetical protein n=1 Tax=Cetobacterium sp. TaxID=2071632 RepID=UPI003EE53FE0